MHKSIICIDGGVMDYTAGELLKKGNNYYVTRKKRFSTYAKMLKNDKEECFDFAYQMTYGEEGEHREHRSGGIIHRTKGQMFINTFQGKMAEFALYRYLKTHQIDVERPDTKKYKKRKWDSFDLDCQGKHISVKSTKSYGQLLLLETRDWNEYGEYIPNLTVGTAKYDYTVLVRSSPDGEQIMREEGLLYQEEEEIPSNIKEILTEVILKRDWEYDFAGFIYYSEFVKLIKEKRIIPQKAMLNGRKEMDAENYYFQAGNMHSIKELFMPSDTSKNDEKKELRLHRKCPNCGKKLVVRKKYNRFWGCMGFFDEKSCRYQEKITDV